MNDRLILIPQKALYKVWIPLYNCGIIPQKSPNTTSGPLFLLNRKLFIHHHPMTLHIPVLLEQ